ncbi:MAG TPA: hypothetical protein VHL09_12100 [Dehalococcoidia bacterium]|nr:hypothetical protein [Dehalococcoidia bacterium]
MPDDRISKLSQRFRTHAVGRRPTSNRNRERHSFYLDAELVTRLDQVYRAVNHELYPESITKSAFLETLIEYGLDHVSDLKAALAQPEEE